MLRNHLLSIFRNLKRNKAYASINIMGLAIGFAATTLIAIYVKSEFTYDQHYAGHEKVYRLSANSFALSSIAHLNQIKNNVAAVEHVVSIMPNPSASLKTESGKSLAVKDYFYVTEEYSDVFKHTFILGNPEGALDAPDALILTESMSRKLYGDKNPIGEQLHVNSQLAEGNFQVTGVIKDLPSNTTISFSAIGRLPAEFIDRVKDSYSFTTGYSYFKTASEMPLDQVKAAVDEALLPIDFERYGEGKSFEEYKETYTSRMMVLPLADVHLNSNIQFEASEPGNVTYLYVFLFIAVFVIILAAINYVNLSTAQASKRAKEIGVRKVLGSFRNQLVYRFIVESVMIAFVAVLIGFGLAEATLKLLQFNGFGHFESNVYDYSLLIAVIGNVALVTGLVAGIYPALYLTRFKPSAVLKGDYKAGSGKRYFRNGLVVFQFVVSLSLAIFSVFISQQLHFSMQKDLGFDKSDVLVIDNSKFQIGDNVDAFRNELKSMPGIESVGFSHYKLTNLALSGFIENNVENAEYKRMQYKYIDAEYAEVMGFELVEGRFLDSELDGDRTAMLVNETLAKNLGGDVLGRRFNANFNGKDVEIVGVIRDFHYEDFRKEIGPVALFSRPYPSLISVRFKGTQQEAIAAAQQIYGKFTAEPFDYELFEQSFDRLFDKERQLGQVINLFTGLSIFVAVLGLIGLISYTLDQRVKEIGIRKVLGASVKQILSMLSREMLWLMLVAFLVSIPLSYYAVSSWMAEFSYHIGIGAWPFILIGLLAMVTILLIVSARSAKAAMSNPVNALRTE
ncbi:FtsX-like permease family protein [Roseivirga sp.]|uniref:ABC transporter permease n=1 Tax=Roseivirga sp. TaxID=1964215 RepID=UPI003B52201D